LETADARIHCAPDTLVAELRRLLLEEATPAPDELRLVGRRDVRDNNSWMHNAPRLVKGKPRHQLWMHPRDLAARALESGQRVRIESSAGAIETEVLASEALMPGVACLPHGFGQDRDGVMLQRARQLAGASYNDLSDPARLEGGCGNAALNGLPIRVSAA
jgi:anaerobic selenocysteine-containing dehydrogenase